MENLDIKTIIGMFIGIIMVAGIFFYPKLKGRKQAPLYVSDKAKKGEKQAVTGAPAECRIYDAITRTIYNKEIPYDEVLKIKAAHGNLGRKWLFNGKYLFALDKQPADSEHESDYYKPVVVTTTLENTPTALHLDLQQADVDIYFDVSEDKSFMQSWGKFLLFAGVIIFFMWAYVSSM